MIKILILAALSEELEPVKKKLSSKFSSNPDVVFTFIKTSIGMKNSAKKVKSQVCENNFDYVINCGSAGSLSTNLKVGNIFFPTTYKLINEYGDLEIITQKEIKKLNMPTHWKIGALYTSDKPILTKNDRRETYRKSDAQAVDMEAFIQARICKEYSVPFFSIKIISDIADFVTIVKFKRNLKLIINKLTDAFALLIKQIIEE